MYRYSELTFSYSFLSFWTHKLRFFAKLLHIPKQAKNVEQFYCISIFNAKNLSCTVGMYIMNQKNHKKNTDLWKIHRYVKNLKKVLLSWSIFIPLTPLPFTIPHPFLSCSQKMCLYDSIQYSKYMCNCVYIYLEENVVHGTELRRLPKNTSSSS